MVFRQRNEVLRGFEFTENVVRLLLATFCSQKSLTTTLGPARRLHPINPQIEALGSTKKMRPASIAPIPNQAPIGRAYGGASDSCELYAVPRRHSTVDYGDMRRFECNTLVERFIWDVL